MSRKVNFHELMMAEAPDFNNIGEFAEGDLNAAINDGLSKERRWADFTVDLQPSKTSVIVSPGRLYDGGKQYRADTQAEFPFQTNLPLSQKRYGMIVAWSKPNVETGTDTRGVAVDADDEIGQPEALQMIVLDQAVVELVLGVESADPQPPAVQSNVCIIARFVIQTDGVQTAIVMNEDARLPSTERLSGDVASLNAFRDRIDPTVSGLISDFAALNARSANKASRDDLARGLRDIARLKDLAGLPDTYAQYGTDFFNDTSKTDTVYSATLSKTENGLLYPDAASSSWPLALFNANDPNAKKHSSGQVLPAYTDVVAIAGPPTIGEISMTQHEVKAHTIKTHRVYRTVSYYGWGWNWAFGWHSYRRVTSASWSYWNRISLPLFWGFWGIRPLKLYYEYGETISDGATSVDAASSVVNGVLSAETFRAPRTMWFTGFNTLLTSLDTTGDINAYLVETQIGQPATAKTLASTMVTVANLKKAPVKTPFMFNPILLESGKLYSVVFITQGNHKIATVDPNNWRDGTYFAGTDGEYFVGDLTKDIYLEILAAEFLKPRNEIVLQTVDLTGGIHDMKIATEQIVPEGTQLSYEINIAGTWKPLETLDALPPGTNLAPLRAVAVGSKDMMPSFYVGTDRIRVSRPANASSHQSSTINLVAPAEDFRIEYVVNKWDAVNHTIAPTIREGVNVRTPDVTEPPVIEDADTVRLGFVFNLPAPISSFKIRTDGTRVSTVAPPAITERTYVALQ